MQRLLELSGWSLLLVTVLFITGHVLLAAINHVGPFSWP